jgi:tRNA-modifying protein YgfZ
MRRTDRGREGTVSESGPAGTTPGLGASEASEYEALTGSVGLLDQPERRVVRVFGEQARRMLNGLVTNRVAPLDGGRAVYTFVLTPKGRPVAEGRLLPAADGAWFDVPVACLEGLEAHLRKYLPPIYARFEVEASIRRMALVGPRADAAIVRAAADLAWPDLTPADVEPLQVVEAPEASTAGLPRLVRREPVEGSGFDLYVAADSASEWREALLDAAEAEGGRAVGGEAREILRVELGIPAYGPEIGPDVLPQETGQEGRAVSLEKGCYTGQEVVARIHYRGRVNRHLRGLSFEGAERPPPAGSDLRRGDRTVGFVTTPAHSPRYGPIALGYVRREIEAGDSVEVGAGGLTARVVALPFTET